MTFYTHGGNVYVDVLWSTLREQIEGALSAGVRWLNNFSEIETADIPNEYRNPLEFTNSPQLGIFIFCRGTKGRLAEYNREGLLVKIYDNHSPWVIMHPALLSNTVMRSTMEYVGPNFHQVNHADKRFSSNLTIHETSDGDVAYFMNVPYKANPSRSLAEAILENVGPLTYEPELLSFAPFRNNGSPSGFVYRTISTTTHPENLANTSGLATALGLKGKLVENRKHLSENLFMETHKWVTITRNNNLVEQDSSAGRRYMDSLRSLFNEHEWLEETEVQQREQT